MRRNPLPLALLLLAAAALPVAAQHEGHPPPAGSAGAAPPAPDPTPQPEPRAETPDAAEPHAGHPPAEAPAAAPHPEHGPATTTDAAAEPPVAPASTDMSHMTGWTSREVALPEGWKFSGMAVARPGWNRQGGTSGDSAWEAPNWTMLSAQRELGGGVFTAMLMNSFEPLSVAEEGSPQLFQTGETFDGRPLVDRQHQHDFFMNVSASWSRRIAPAAALLLQAAPVGEPALGPTAFMHRASSGENPAAPLGHHHQDASHITFNVLTAGIAVGPAILEASAFHGGEPDENRWDIEGGRIDSVSGRFRLDLPGGWSGQVSHGFLEEPEPLEPGDLRRTTASVHYGAAGDRRLAATFLWGRNDEEHGTSDAFLAEAAWQLAPAVQLYSRAEQVERDEALLISKGSTDGEGEEGDHEHIVKIRALTVGGHVGRRIGRFEAGLGAGLTFYRYPRALEEAYGHSPVSAHVFLTLAWNRRMHSPGGHH